MSKDELRSLRDVTPTSHDAALDQFSEAELRAEVITLRNAIRLHRDERGHDRCWLDDGRLYGILPEAKAAVTKLPDWPEFCGNCRKFWEQRQNLGE